ncbi:hypothetical protein SAMN04487783_0065 [Agrococcus baldri]|uniref:Uncharacterized protein n=1 Tax=Agrococcus baldri TaxID=153730 RepID=A0AA94HK48_9MICO|nr:hypothetical protein [Agrococcus baldri]SFR97166.1 hypothetical protein SAMN04487783_0065 [Agrococcus baldri]
MTDAHGQHAGGTDEHATDGLVDELDLLEQQPLEERAEQLARIHDKLQAELGAVRG